MSLIKRCLLLILFLASLSSPAYTDQIHNAAKDGDFEKIKVLLSSNPDLINSQDDFGATPLHWAGVRGHVNISMYLIKNGADVNIKENHGAPPLHWAAHFDHTNVIYALISKGAKVDEKNMMGRTALHVAARRGCLKVVKVLIELNSDINAQTKQGQTSLHIAAQYGHKNVYAFLLSEGALRNIKDEKGKVPSELYYERPKPIQIDRKKYANYVGKYERQPGNILEISRENDKLFYISLVLDEIYPIAEHTFMSKSELFQITFVMNGENKIVEMKYNDRGRGFTARKVNLK